MNKYIKGSFYTLVSFMSLKMYCMALEQKDTMELENTIESKDSTSMSIAVLDALLKQLSTAVSYDAQENNENEVEFNRILQAYIVKVYAVDRKAELLSLDKKEARAVFSFYGKLASRAREKNYHHVKNLLLKPFIKQLAFGLQYCKMQELSFITDLLGNNEEEQCKHAVDMIILALQNHQEDVIIKDLCVRFLCPTIAIYIGEPKARKEIINYASALIKPLYQAKNLFCLEKLKIIFNYTEYSTSLEQYIAILCSKPEIVERYKLETDYGFCIDFRQEMELWLYPQKYRKRQDKDSVEERANKRLLSQL